VSSELGPRAAAKPDTIPVALVATFGHRLAPVLDARLKELAKSGRFSGVVLLARGDEILFRRAYGLASREYGIVNTPATCFNLASVGKMFTAVAVMKLVEGGQVRLDDPISNYLDRSWISPDVGQRVSIAQLLSHTSGLGDFFTPAFFARNHAQLMELADYKPLVADTKLAFAPGTKWGYSNIGYVLLGALLEQVTHQSFDDAVRRLVFDPTGMTRTAAFDLEAVNHGYAQGYFKEPTFPATQPMGPPPPDFREAQLKMEARQSEIDAKGFEWRNNIFTHVAKGGPPGGGFSNADDMLRFLNALFGGRLVRPATLAKMTAPKPASPHYGFGIQLMDGGFGHTGGFPGISNTLIAYPDGYRLIVLSNIDGGSAAATTAMMRLARLVQAKPVAR
jgi:CubicO group peptidase (beta-lactamase class C family)